jgi:hypothetical protein
MREDLVVQTGFLLDLGHDLRAVALEFEHANAHSDDAGHAVGHGDLADHLHDFAHNWDDRRKKVMGNIQKLGESAVGVGEAFEKVENDLVKGLKGEK